MKWFDKFFENKTRNIARTSSRRSFLSNVGKAVVGVSVIPALPVAKAASGGAPAGAHYPGVSPQTSGSDGDPGDPTTCEYWRYCGIDGFLKAQLLRRVLELKTLGHLLRRQNSPRSCACQGCEGRHFRDHQRCDTRYRTRCISSWSGRHWRGSPRAATSVKQHRKWRMT